MDIPYMELKSTHTLGLWAFEGHVIAFVIVVFCYSQVM